MGSCSHAGGAVRRRPLRLRIAALLHAYGAEEPFIRAWISGEDGLPACALLLFGDTVILSRAGQADWEELSAFLHMLPGAERLLCDEETCRALGFPGEAAGPRCGWKEPVLRRKRRWNGTLPRGSCTPCCRRRRDRALPYRPLRSFTWTCLTASGTARR